MQQQLNVIYDLHTSPPLSLSPIILGCADSLIMHSAGKSIPVFAGTLYKITGIGELSETCQTVWIKNHSLMQLQHQTKFIIQYAKGERHDFTLKLKKQFTSASLNDRFTGWM